MGCQGNHDENQEPQVFLGVKVRFDIGYVMMIDVLVHGANDGKQD